MIRLHSVAKRKKQQKTHYTRLYAVLGRRCREKKKTVSISLHNIDVGDNKDDGARTGGDAWAILIKHYRARTLKGFNAENFSRKRFVENEYEIIYNRDLTRNIVPVDCCNCATVY